MFSKIPGKLFLIGRRKKHIFGLDFSNLMYPSGTQMKIWVEKSIKFILRRLQSLVTRKHCKCLNLANTV